MKKFISMVMAAAMVVSMVPATAFAASGTANFVVAGDLDVDKNEAANLKTNRISGPEIQMALTSVVGNTADQDEFELTLNLGNAEVSAAGLDAPDVVGYVVRTLENNQTAQVGEVQVARNAVHEDTTIELKAVETVDVVAAKEASFTVDFAGAALNNKWVNGDKLTLKVGGASTTVTVTGPSLGDAAIANLFDGETITIGGVGGEVYTGGTPVGTKVTFTSTNKGYMASNKWLANASVELDGAATDKDAVLTLPTAEFVVAADRGTNAAVAATNKQFQSGDKIIIYVDKLNLNLTTASEGAEATVQVEGDFGASEDMPFVSIKGMYLDINVAGANKEVAEGDKVTLNTITIKSKPVAFAAGTEVFLKVKGGFEFISVDGISATNVTKVGGQDANYADSDDDEIVLVADGKGNIVLTNVKLEAVDANAGDIATLVVSAKDYDKDSDEAAVVIADGVVLEVEDADVPVMYSGVNAEEDFLTSSNDHESLEVTIKETAVEAWNTREAFTLTLPEGVYVTAVDADGNGHVTVEKAGGPADFDGMFTKAYVEGDFEEFAFPTRSFSVAASEKGKITFTLTLVADPTFEGDVVLGLESESIEKQEVVIANFVPAVVFETTTNDVIIDYKETTLDTTVDVIEAEAGLWKVGTKIGLGMEQIGGDDSIVIEAVDAATPNDASEMEVKKSGASFTVKEKSDDEAAVVTFEGIQLYMERNIPAGSYDLTMTGDLTNSYNAEVLLGQAAGEDLGDVTGWDHMIEGFVNVITAGRDQDDATFTTEVVVTVGNTEFFVGGEAYTMDVPAYINADSRTMMPIRAVATALGINDDCVRWDGATKTITILYGQRTITMKAGDRMVYINAAVMPATTAVEIVNGRAFLPLRDLAAALGVTDVEWDGATQTATLNGSY